MVEATSKIQLGLSVGDTFGGSVIRRVFSDGVYGWDDSHLGVNAIGPFPTVASMVAALATAKEGDLAHLSVTDGTRPQGLYRVLPDKSLETTPFVDLTGVTPVAATPVLVTDSPSDSTGPWGTFTDQATLGLTLTAGDVTGQAVRLVTDRAAGYSVFMYEQPTPSAEYTILIDQATWTTGEIFYARVSARSSTASVGVNRDGTRNTTGSEIDDGDGDASMTYLSSEVVNGVVVLKVRADTPGTTTERLLRFGVGISTQPIGSGYSYVIATAAASTITPKRWMEYIYGEWSGSHATNAGHNTLNVGFDIERCTRLSFTMRDDSGSPWSWTGDIDVQELISGNSTQHLMPRLNGQYIWLRRAGVSLAAGQLSVADQGGVAATIRRVVGYAREER